MSERITVIDRFVITNEEHELLQKKFGKLCYYIAHQLQKKNTKNNYTEDFEDIVQELQFALVTAAAYYKRQVWIENCFKFCKESIKDKYFLCIIDVLEDLWQNRTRHGANRQKFGLKQEEILWIITKNKIAPEVLPNRDGLLKINSKFSTYCKSVLWNKEKNMGKKITRDKSIRSGAVSISEFDYLAKE